MGMTAKQKMLLEKAKKLANNRENLKLDNTESVDVNEVVTFNLKKSP